MKRVVKGTTPEAGRVLATSRSTRTPRIDPRWMREGGKVPTTGKVYVGIDLSLAKTGIVALSEDGSFYWWRIHRPAPSEMTGSERLAVHRWMLTDFFASLPDPTLVCMEGYSFGSKGSSVFQIAEWGGVARLTLHDMGLEDRTVIMAPSTLKKFVTNNGNSPKNVVLREVYRVWGIEAADDNVADAYGLAQAAMTISTGNARYSWQRDALRRTGPPHGAPAEQ